MVIQELKERPEINENQKLRTAYAQFDRLLTELRTRELPKEIIKMINDQIAQLNSFSGLDQELKARLRKAQTTILKLLEKELKIVMKGHYRTTWLALGMTVFGLPLGIVFGASIGNMAFLGTGLPIGMAIGIAVGTAMDKKAFEEGRQIDLDVK